MAHYQAVVRSKNGNVVPGANVSVFEEGTSILADLFEDEALTIPVDNPVQSDACGKVGFYLVSGEYDILVQRFDIEDVRFDDVSILEESPTGFSPKYIVASLSAQQTTNIGAGDHVEFDQELESSGHITLSTGTGQENGVFTIPSGVWRIVMVPSATFSGATGEVFFRWFNVTSGVQLDTSPVRLRHVDNASNPVGPLVSDFILVTPTPILAEVRFPSAPVGLNNVQASTSATIFAIS